MLFGEGPQIKNIAADLNKLFRQGSLLNQSVQNFEGDSTADQGTRDLLAARDPVIQEISVGMSGEQSARYTVSGTPPLSLPNSLGEPLKAWSVDLSPYQEGSGDPSPDNVRPIHGTDKLTITTAGKNLLNKTDFVAETSNTTVTTTDTGIKILVTGIGTYRCAINANVIDYASVAGKTVTLSYHNTNLDGGIARYRISLYKQDGTPKQSLAENAQSTDGNVTKTITVPDNVADAYSLGIVLYANGNHANGASVEYSNLQLEFGSTATPYTPYLAPSQTVITLPQTVYTGTIGSEGGKTTWGNIASYNGETLTGEWISSMDVYSAGTTPTIGAQVVYELATPTTFTLTSPTIPTPTGTATTWATAEDGTVDGMEVTYVGKA